MASLLLKVRELFNLAQDGRVVLSKICERMSSLQTEATEDQFWDAFIHHAQKAIIYFKNEPAVERVVDLIASFATFATRQKNNEITSSNEEKEKQVTPSDGSEDGEDEPMEPFLLKCFNFFVTHHNAREKGVRLRCCQLVNKMLNLLGDTAAIDEDLSDSIYECMMVRIKDVYPPIRVQAVLALFRLQDPTDEECPVIDAYLSSVAKDIHPLVRKTILSKLAISRKSLPFLIERVRDAKDIIRKTAFMILGQKVSIKALSIAQRISLVTDGLKNERSEEVKKACCDMLKAWFRTCKHDFIKLLEALDIESDTECSEIVTKNLLNDATSEQLQEYVVQVNGFTGTNNQLNAADEENILTPEKVFFWYSICKHMKTLNDGDTLLQQILPELTPFTNYIRSYAEKHFMDSSAAVFDGISQTEFILDHLLNIVGLLDLSDEIGKQNLQLLVHDLLVLQSIPLSIVDVLVKRFKDVANDEDSFVQNVVETISDIKQPLVQVVSTAMKEKTRMLQLQLARISVSIQDCKEDLECAVKQQDFLQAGILKDHISELEKQKEDFNIQLEESQEQFTQRVECDDDPSTLLKCLTVGTSMLSLVVKRGLSSTLMSLKDELFLEGVKNEDPCIRNESIKGLGLLSLLKKEFAAQHLVFFLQVVQVDQEFVKITAIKTIFDLFLMYGVTTFNSETEADVTSKSEDTLIEGDKTLEDTVIAETPPENQGEDDKDMNEKDNGATSAAENVLSVLLMFLQNESSDLRSVVAEGLAKVMITGRVVSANVLTRLILLWYNPIMEDDLQLRHCLGVFLPAFAFQSRKNQELVEQAFLPALRTITNAPPNSPLCQINIGNVIDLFVQLTDVRNLEKIKMRKGFQDDYDHYIHDSIAMKISNEILSDTEDPDIKVLCKTLNQLTICPRNTMVIRDLMELSVQMINALESNRTARNLVEKFSLHLQELSLISTNATQNQTIQGTNDKLVIRESDDKENDDPFAESHDNTVISVSSVKKAPRSARSKSTYGCIDNDNDVFSEHDNTVISVSSVKNAPTRSARSKSQGMSTSIDGDNKDTSVDHVNTLKSLSSTKKNSRSTRSESISEYKDGDDEDIFAKSNDSVTSSTSARKTRSRGTTKSTHPSKLKKVVK